jgi:membrane protein YdbS with pleckstrin-like domain
MPFPDNILDEGEEVVLNLRPHWRRVVVPVVLIPIVVGLASYLWFVLPDDKARGPLRIAVLVVALAVLLWWSLRPWLRWLTTRYVMTTRRVVTRTGVLSRNGRDVPMTRINDVSFSHTAFERLLRCGTLVVESAGERGQVTLTDIPRVEQIQRRLYELVEADENRRREEDGPEPTHT